MREQMLRQLSLSRTLDCDALFANLYMWQPLFDYRYGIIDNRIAIRCRMPDTSEEVPQPARRVHYGVFVPGAAADEKTVIALKLPPDVN